MKKKLERTRPTISLADPNISTNCQCSRCIVGNVGPGFLQGRKGCEIFGFAASILIFFFLTVHHEFANVIGIQC